MEDQILTVEIDESLFAKRKNNVGRVYPQQWVFGGFCRETKECFLCPVEDRSAGTLLPLIVANIEPGSIIMSDEWRSYRQIVNLPQQYTHLTVNHSYNFVDPQTGAHTQSIESMWRSCKRRNVIECGTRRDRLDFYLSEFMWQTRNANQDLFEKMLEDIKKYEAPL